MRGNIRSRLFAPVLLGATILIAGCGGSQATGSAPAAATTAPAPKAASTTAPPAAPAAGQVSFKTDIQPIFASACAGCHGQAGGLSLASLADVMKGGKDGAVVKPGDADGSLLVQKVKGTQTIGARMPRGGSPLPDDQIKKISDWVAQGAKDN